MLSDQRNAYIREILADLKAAGMLDAGTVLLIQGALAEQERLAAFVARLRHPEEFGWAVTQEVRAAARAALLGPQPAGTPPTEPPLTAQIEARGQLRLVN